MSQSCLDCPSMLTTQQATKFFNKSIGVPVCARFGKPLGRIKSSLPEVTEISKTFAKNCDSYGKPAPITPDWKTADFQVMLPDPQSTLPGAGNMPEAVRTCLNCSNYIDLEVVVKGPGWGAGMCAAQGKLILGNRTTLEARNCDYRSFGTPRPDMAGMTFIPEYAENFTVAGDPVAAHAKAKANFVDPTEYETDKEVSAEDAAHGIRAWREIKDPMSDNSVWLPIYDLNHFSPEEQAKIPRTGDDEHPEDYVDHAFYLYKVVVLWTELDETPAFWGQAGTGKTEFFRFMAWLMCLPFERLSFTGSTELDDIAGKWLYENGETVFEFGRLPRAWGKPCVIILDEPNTAPADVWQFIRPLTDNSKQLVLDMAKGQRITRHSDAYLGLAMNPAWDMNNIGTQMIGDADANRLMHFSVGLPDDKLEREIIETRCKHDGWDIPRDKMDALMAIADDIRTNIQSGSLQISWAIRPQIKVARALRWFDFLTAYRMAAADYLEPKQADQVLDIVRSNVEL